MYDALEMVKSDILLSHDCILGSYNHVTSFRGGLSFLLQFPPLESQLHFSISNIRKLCYTMCHGKQNNVNYHYEELHR